MAQSHATDAMIRRLERELEERNSAVQAIVENVQNDERDMNESEQQTVTGLKSRMVELRHQLDVVESTEETFRETNNRLAQLDQAMTTSRKGAEAGVVEYRSAGAWALDSYQASLGDRQAAERLEVYNRVAAHQKTGDNLGVIPDPVIGPVVNFIDAARPIVSAIGPQPLVAATWHRPVVTQHTSVDPQGVAGAAADEKLELISQKMTITRLPATAVTYGGYVNVSRQNIDFSSPQILDIIINDLAAQYAIQTEAATAAELSATGTTPVTYPATPTADEVSAALWEAAAGAYTAVKGQGRLVLAVAPDVLSIFGPLFAPVNPQNAQSTGQIGRAHV